MLPDLQNAAKDSLLDTIETLMELNPAMRRSCLEIAYSSGRFDGLVQMARVGEPSEEQYSGTLIPDLWSLVEKKDKVDA